MTKPRKFKRRVELDERFYEYREDLVETAFYLYLVIGLVLAAIKDLYSFTILTGSLALFYVIGLLIIYFVNREVYYEEVEE